MWMCRNYWCYGSCFNLNHLMKDIWFGLCLRFVWQSSYSAQIIVMCQVYACCSLLLSPSSPESWTNIAKFCCFNTHYIFPSTFLYGSNLQLSSSRRMGSINMWSSDRMQAQILCVGCVLSIDANRVRYHYSVQIRSCNWRPGFND